MLLWCLVMKTHYWTVQNSKKCIWTNETGVNRAGQFMVVDTHSCSYRELHDNSSVLYWETISLDKVYGIAFWLTHYMTAKRFSYKALCYFSKKSRVITLIYSWFIVFTWQVFKFRFEYNVCLPEHCDVLSRKWYRCLSEVYFEFWVTFTSTLHQLVIRAKKISVFSCSEVTQIKKTSLVIFGTFYSGSNTPW